MPINYKEAYYSFFIYLESIDSMYPGLFVYLGRDTIDLGKGEVNLMEAFNLASVSPTTNFNNDKLVQTIFNTFSKTIWPRVVSNTEDYISL